MDLTAIDPSASSAIRDLPAYCQVLAEQARAASLALATTSGAIKNDWLCRLSSALEERMEEVIFANGKDVAAAGKDQLKASEIDRLLLTPDRVLAAATGIRQVAALADPVGSILDSNIRPNGLQVHKVAVPLGVIFFIYESRPNVTLDAAALAVKSGNAIILRGGSESFYSNGVLHQIIQDCLSEIGLPRAAVQIVATPDRAAVGHLLRLPEFIDLVIPRGGKDLIRRVAEEALMPVLKHYKGNCHVYIDRAADFEMAERILVNAKCQRPGVCNAAESLLVHRDIASSFLPSAATVLRQHGVQIRGCEETKKWVPDAVLATEEDFAAEFLDLILSVKIVTGIEEAIDHIHRFGSKHTETIVTTDPAAARLFTSAVDSSAVFVNASTRFNDGFELGMGAEIGISTDKYHARGPCGLRELTSYKYVVYGDGQVRGE